MKIYFEVNQDITELLGIKQYEATMDIDPVTKVVKERSKVFKYFMRFKWFRMTFGRTKKEKHGFPDFISKTDETRVQNIPHLLGNKDIKYTVTEKVDGSSVTMFLKKLRFGKYDFGVCSRNLRLKRDMASVYWQVAEKHNIESVLKELIGNNDFVAIQGEIIAPKIQGNKYKVTEPQLYVFNLKYPNKQIDSVTGSEILSHYGIEYVPILETEFVLPDTVNELLDYATGTSELYETMREGIVLRNYEKNISFKAVSPDFLIYHKE